MIRLEVISPHTPPDYTGVKFGIEEVLSPPLPTGSLPVVIC